MYKGRNKLISYSIIICKGIKCEHHFFNVSIWCTFTATNRQIQNQKEREIEIERERKREREKEREREIKIWFLIY